MATITGLEIQIGTATYLVRLTDDASAYLVCRDGQEPYRVDANLSSCSCPAAKYGKGGICKHAQGLRDVFTGLIMRTKLPEPASDPFVRVRD